MPWCLRSGPRCAAETDPIAWSSSTCCGAEVEVKTPLAAGTATWEGQGFHGPGIKASQIELGRSGGNH